MDVAVIEAGLRSWMASVRYASFDPYDGLSAGFPWSVARKNRLTARIWTQFIKRCPWNLRPWFGIRPRVLSKTFSDLASSFVLRHRLSDPQAEAAAREALGELRRRVRPGHAGACWALETPYVTRHTLSHGNEPNIFWTINAANAFLDAFEVWGGEEDLSMARSAIDFVFEDLGYVEEEPGVWFRYFASHDAVVYNVTAMMGTLLLRISAHGGEDELATVGTRALDFVRCHQNEDGSWFYARGDSGRWIDGFHTGYILEALCRAQSMRPSAEIQESLRRGVHYYEEHLFTDDHLPCYYPEQRFPVDVQNAAQAIQTLAQLGASEPRFVDLAAKVAQAVHNELWLPVSETAGYYAANRGRYFLDRTPMIRWGQAPMLLALNTLLALRAGLSPTWPQPQAGS